MASYQPITRQGREIMSNEEEPRKAPPPRPPRPHPSALDRNQSIGSSSFPQHPQRPAPDDRPSSSSVTELQNSWSSSEVNGSPISTRRVRRGSDSEFLPHSRQHPHSNPRAQSTRRSGRRKKRVRPEITIVSSEPMSQHPAFADGSKGGYIPPEAPPSYDEAMKSQPPSNHTYTDPPTPDHILQGRRAYPEIEISERRAPSPALRRCRTEVRRTPLVDIQQIPLNNSSDHNLPLVVDLPVRRPRNSNHNNGTQNSDIPGSSTDQNSSNQSIESTKTATEQTPPVPIPRGRVNHQTTATASNSNPQTVSTNKNHPTTKPTVPPKKPGLAKLAQKRNTPSASNTSNMNSPPINLFDDSGSSVNLPPPIMPVTPTRKLPPPPRPTAGPKISPISTPNSTLVIDDVFGYASINNKQNMQPTDLQSPFSINFQDSVLQPTNIVPTQHFVPQSTFTSSSLLDDDSNDFGYASIQRPQASATVDTTTPCSDKNVPEKNQTPEKKDLNIDGLLGEWANMSLTTPSPVDKEPTYAALNKKTSIKPKPAVTTLQPTAVDGGTTSPPPIPTTRPPLEDYADLFSENHSSSQQTSTVSNDPFTDLFQPPIPNTRHPAVDYTGLMMENSVPQPNTVPSNTSGQDLEDFFGSGFTPQPNQTPIPIPAKRESNKDENINLMDQVAIESPYEVVKFQNNVEPSTNKPEEPLPRVNQSKTPIPPKRKKSVRVGPPLPNAAPVGNSHNPITEENTKPNSGAVVKREKSGNAGNKGLKNLRRKSIHFKEKSMSFFKGNSDNKSPKTKTNQRKMSSPTLSTGTVAVSSDNIVSTPAQPVTTTATTTTPKKRAAPPRPVMPKILQQRQAKSTSSLPIDTVDSTPIAQPQAVNKPQSKPLRPTRPAPVKPPPVKSPTRPPISLLDSPLNANQPPPVPRPRVTNTEHAVVKSDLLMDTDSYNFENNPTDLSTSSIPSKKPDRPPPVIAIPLGSVKLDTEEKPTSFIDMLKTGEPGTAEGAESKPQVDIKMKQYITEELSCVAVRDYCPDNFTDLQFMAGEKLTVIKRIDEKLLFGRNSEGEEGTFPEEFVQIEGNQNNNSNHKSDDFVFLQSQIDENQNNNYNNNKSNDLIPQSQNILISTHPYQSDNAEDLTFNVGTEILILETIDADWCRGQIGGKSGLFPSNFVTTKENFYASTNQHSSDVNNGLICTAIHDFAGELENELSFAAGSQIKLISRVNDEWVKGSFKNKIGIFPMLFVDFANFDSLPVELTPQSVNTVEEITNNVPETTTNENVLFSDDSLPSKMAVSLHPFQGSDTSELSFDANCTIHITGQINEEWFEGTCDGKSGIFPSNFVQILE